MRGLCGNILIKSFFNLDKISHDDDAKDDDEKNVCKPYILPGLC